MREGAEHVHQLWEVLQVETERRSVMLNAALQAQQYYSQAAKAESWLADHKLQLANEEKGLVGDKTAARVHTHGTHADPVCWLPRMREAPCSC